MKVLVTGAGGFIGAHVVRRLMAGGHETFALVRPGSSTRRIEDVRDRIEVVEADLGQGDAAGRVLREVRPAAVIHLAWYAEPGRYLHAVAENVASLEASARLLVAAAEQGCERVVLGGTCLEHAATSERTIYAAAKDAVHRLSNGFADTGLRIACGHVFYLFGPWEDPRRVVPSVIRALLAGQSIATTDGLQLRDYLPVSEVAAALCLLAESPVTGRVDICSGSPVTLADLLRMIAEQVGRPELLRLGELGPTAGDALPSTGDPGVLERLGWRQRQDIHDAVIETIAWWNAQEGRR
jgi:nucleoside-diphosphate-sugar epimerase